MVCWDVEDPGSVVRREIEREREREREREEYYVVLVVVISEPIIHNFTRYPYQCHRPTFQTKADRYLYHLLRQKAGVL